MSTIRRARPLLGTLVEVGVAAMAGATADGSEATQGPAAAGAAPAQAVTATTSAIDAAFAEVARLERVLSRFDACSDIGRFNAARAGTSLGVTADTAAVLRCAAALQAQSDGAFDVSTGTAPRGWSLEGMRLAKHDAAARLDLGGIGKGYAVDRAIAVLEARGCTAGWVNAGGDLRVFGALEVPLLLRDEERGGVRRFGALADGAFATSRFGPGARDVLVGTTASAAPETLGEVSRHVSVAAPTCMLADALAKVVAASADAAHPILACHRARAFVHAASGIGPLAILGTSRP